MYQTILYTIENQVATVTINREEYGNAFSETTYQEIIDVMVDIDQNPGKGGYLNRSRQVFLQEEMLPTPH